MAKRKRQLAVGRYDERVIACRIEELRKKRGVSARELCARIGMGESDYSRKARCIVSFSLAQYETIATVLDAPLGWPFVTDDVARAFDALARPDAAGMRRYLAGWAEERRPLPLGELLQSSRHAQTRSSEQCVSPPPSRDLRGHM
jgi:transcriptional regulator with XRE-family HTH domain